MAHKRTSTGPFSSQELDFISRLRCRHCGTASGRTSGLWRQRTREFCTVKCAKQHQGLAKRPDPKPCQGCGKMIPFNACNGSVKAYTTYSKQRFCSYLCSGRGKALASSIKAPQEKKCSSCGIAMSRKPKELLCHWASRKFCSRKCVGQSNARRYASLPSTRRSTNRTAVRSGRVKVRCSRCKSRSHLHYHHVDRNWKNDAPENVEVLCAGCHRHEHRNDDVSEQALRRGAKRRKTTFAAHKRNYSDRKCLHCNKSIWAAAVRKIRPSERGCSGLKREATRRFCGADCARYRHMYR